jgi:ribosome biogenesis GTPase A
MTLETPDVIDIEIQQVAVMKAEKEEQEKHRLEEKAARRRKTKANRR